MRCAQAVFPQDSVEVSRSTRVLEGKRLARRLAVDVFVVFLLDCVSFFVCGQRTMQIFIWSAIHSPSGQLETLHAESNSPPVR